MKRLVIAAILAATVFPVSAQAPSVMGLWLTESKAAQVQVAPCADAARGPLCATIVKLLEAKGDDGKPVVPGEAVDRRNADASLRTRKIEGMVFLYDFKKRSEPNAFEGGTIYNVEDGKTYSANIALQADGTLRLRGYAGLAMFGKTQIWTRLQ